MKNRSAFRLLLAANAISGFAQGISMLSIPWYFGSVLNQSSVFNFSTGIITLASIAWSLYAGTLIDKYPRKNVFLGVNLFGGIILGSVAVYGFISGSVPPPLILLVFGATLFIYAIHYPALYAFGQEITEKENYGRMNSMLEIQGQSTTMLAGAAGTIMLAGTHHGFINLAGLEIPLGFDIKPWSLQQIFLLDGITYIITLVLIGMIRYTPALEKHQDEGSILERISGGFKFLKAHPALFWFGNSSYAIFAFLLIEVQLLVAPYISRHLHADPSAYTSAEIWYTVGALFAGLAIRSLFKNTHTVKAILLMMLMTIAGIFITAFSASIAWFLFFSVLIGITNAGTRILRITFLYSHIPNHIIGRSTSVFNVINTLMRALLSFLFAASFFTESDHVIFAYCTGGLFLLLWMAPMIIYSRQLIR